MKIAIIGTGFYGSSLAITLSKKFQVDLYEKESKIFNGASSCNQFRFHSGYHYPRSQKTVNEINKSKKDFINFFTHRVFENTINYYSIARKSKVNFAKYKKFLKKNKLFFKEVELLKGVSTIEKSILVREKILNLKKTKNILKKKIKKNKIKLLLDTEFKKKDIIKYDKIIVATYANNNSVLSKLGVTNLSINKYQLVEKILIKLPKKFEKKSFVVMDGNFVCVDPFLGTKYHLLSDVRLSKLETVTSILPKFSSSKKYFLNKGVIRNIKISRFKKFISNSSKYLPFLKHAKYIGSMFVVRALKKDKEKTDERVTSINHHTNKIISIFSGKWNNCVYLAKNLKIK